MKKFHVVDVHQQTHVVRGTKFTIMDPGHLVVSNEDTPVALFAQNTWTAVKEMDEN